jgi:CBS domain-containing protein
MTSCREVMTSNPVCCTADDTVDKVAQMMRNEDVGPVPVVESIETKRLIGIVTDRDLALKVVAEGRDPRSTRVAEVMTVGITTCHPSDDLQVALDAMAANQVRRIPVVDESGAIIGIIAQADVAIRTDDTRQTGEMVEEISKPA